MCSFPNIHKIFEAISPWNPNDFARFVFRAPLLLLNIQVLLLYILCIQKYTHVYTYRFKYDWRYIYIYIYLSIYLSIYIYICPEYTIIRCSNTLEENDIRTIHHQLISPTQVSWPTTSELHSGSAPDLNIPRGIPGLKMVGIFCVKESGRFESKMPWEHLGTLNPNMPWTSS